MTDFSDQFRKIIMRYKRIGYNLNVMRQSACLVINPITVNGLVADPHSTPFRCGPCWLNKIKTVSIDYESLDMKLLIKNLPVFV